MMSGQDTTSNPLLKLNVQGKSDPDVPYIVRSIAATNALLAQISMARRLISILLDPEKPKGNPAGINGLSAPQ